MKLTTAEVANATEKFFAELEEDEKTLVDAITKSLTPETLARFLKYAKDAGNWNGTPLVGGNVGGDPADKGYLTAMKKAGIITTWEDRDRINGRVTVSVWMEFTDAGKALAKANGVTL